MRCYVINFIESWCPLFELYCGGGSRAGPCPECPWGTPLCTHFFNLWVSIEEGVSKFAGSGYDGFLRLVLPRDPANSWLKADPLSPISCLACCLFQEATLLRSGHYGGLRCDKELLRHSLVSAGPATQVIPNEVSYRPFDRMRCVVLVLCWSWL